MKISIALASYNGEDFIEEQLDSFIRQSRKPDEVVISDDGSQDRTLEIVEDFGKKAPFEVRILRDQENLGYAGNFNRALSATTGDLVFLSDQDDVWLPEKVGRMERVSQDNPSALLIMCDAELTDRALIPFGLTKIGQIRSGGLPMTRFVMGCCVAVHRELLDMVLPITQEYCAHDTWLVRIADGINCKIVVDEVLQYYRRHGKNQSECIANKTELISRWDVVRKRVVNLRKHPDKMRQNIVAEKQLRAGVERAEQRARTEWQEPLRALKMQLDWKIEVLESRVAIRKLSLVRRVPRVINLWRRGGYGAFGSYKSALRDIAFK